MGHWNQSAVKAHNRLLSFSLLPTIPHHSQPVWSGGGVHCHSAANTNHKTQSDTNSAISAWTEGFELKMKKDNNSAKFYLSSIITYKKPKSFHNTYTLTTSNQWLLYDDTQPRPTALFNCSEVWDGVAKPTGINCKVNRQLRGRQFRRGRGKKSTPLLPRPIFSYRSETAVAPHHHRSAVKQTLLQDVSEAQIFEWELVDGKWIKCSEKIKKKHFCSQKLMKLQNKPLQLPIMCAHMLSKHKKVLITSANFTTQESWRLSDSAVIISLDLISCECRE